MHSHDPNVVVLVATFCGLILFLAVIRHYTKNTLMPPEVWTLLGGIAYGITVKEAQLKDWPQFVLGPEIVILVFLPLLIFASGRLIRFEVLEREALPVAFFAVIGVLATAVLIGFPVAWVLGIPLQHGLLLGAAVGATDPAAVGSIFHAFTIPERLAIMVEGESLFNDGTTVVFFAIVSATVLGYAEFSWVSALGQFSWAVIGAVPLGAMFGWGAAKILNTWRENNEFYEVSVSLVMTYTTFLTAEVAASVSGVIAVLFAALVFIKTREKDAERYAYKAEYQEDRAVFSRFWDFLALLTNGILFFLLGAATGLHDFQEVPFVAVLTAVGSLIFARAVVVYGGSLILRAVAQRISLAWQNVLMLGGLRGAVSAALILLIPHDYPHRGIFLCLAFAMIAFSLIVQPIVMKAYLNRWRV